MNVEVSIYLSNIIKFFNSNPNDLKNLVPESKKTDFFEKIKLFAIRNVENGEDPSLTKQQLIDICVEINGKPKFVKPKVSDAIISTKFGDICLN
jgi:hypothetical protein